MSTAQKPCLFYMYLLQHSLWNPAYIKTTQGNGPLLSPKVQHTRIRGEKMVSCFDEDPNQRIHWCESEHEAKYDGFCSAFAEVKTRTNRNADSGGADGERWPCPKGRGPSLKYGRVGLCSSVVRAAVPGPGVAGCIWGCLSECGFLVRPDSEGRVIRAYGCRYSMGETRGHTQSVYSPHNASFILLNIDHPWLITPIKGPIEFEGYPQISPIDTIASCRFLVSNVVWPADKFFILHGRLFRFFHDNLCFKVFLVLSALFTDVYDIVRHMFFTAQIHQNKFCVAYCLILLPPQAAWTFRVILAMLCIIGFEGDGEVVVAGWHPFAFASHAPSG
ncbi:hypothetical protein B0H17DRAFT_1147554 [Mycena rosella]|uniref:Uncharacterized protein n=1 Tax=Mycena rosella TaxID=1033263 RepID=A0AAD7G3N6_MYCRO|nr:hypothetical protein B0H17DRAFT_1147554 [Mycena rosella]